MIGRNAWTVLTAERSNTLSRPAMHMAACVYLVAMAIAFFVTGLLAQVSKGVATGPQVQVDATLGWSFIGAILSTIYVGWIGVFVSLVLPAPFIGSAKAPRAVLWINLAAAVAIALWKTAAPLVPDPIVIVCAGVAASIYLWKYGAARPGAAPDQPQSLPSRPASQLPSRVGQFAIAVALAIVALAAVWVALSVQTPAERKLATISTSTLETSVVIPPGDAYSLVIGLPKYNTDFEGDVAIRSGGKVVMEFPISQRSAVKCNWLDNTGGLQGFILQQLAPKNLGRGSLAGKRFQVTVSFTKRRPEGSSLWLFWITSPVYRPPFIGPTR